MRTIFLLSFCCFAISGLWAQQAPAIFGGCGTESMMQRSPALLAQRKKTDLKWQQQAFAEGFSPANRVLPVVVHIVHNNGPENISDAQVQQGITQLNNAFAGLAGAGANTEIQFCLAQQDPSGLATSGITRNVSALTNMVMETQDLDLKDLVRWAPTCYINIWVVAGVNSSSSGPGVAGYAYFPSAHGTPIDGIVMEAAYFGSSQQNTSVLVHEMGHYLGLYHTFEGGCPNNNCLAEGDQVCDTPPDQSTFASCAPNANSCNTDADDPGPNNPFSTDVPDMGENFMDYSDISCYIRFTPGQADRMNWHLTQVRASLLACKSCQSPCPVAAVATILTPPGATTILAGATQAFSGSLSNALNPQWRLGSNTVFASGTTASYTFNTPGTYWVYFLANSSSPALCDATLDSVKIVVECGAQAAFSTPNDQPDPGISVPFSNLSQNAQSYQWWVNGVQTATTLNYNHVFNTPGVYTVLLTASNGICTDTATQLIFVGCQGESKRGTYWYFGAQAGLRFDPGGPVALVDNAMTAQQGNATISDKSGNLLFYSNGLRVYNRNHAVMPNGNGLIGSDISAQSCLIVPAPGNSNRYYLFTTSNWLDAQHQLAYSVIDMTLNGGLGDVVAGLKNIVLNQNVSELATAVNHRNCQDVWIISHEMNNNRYVAYLLSPAGVSNAPVISGTGNIYTGANRSGSLRASHNGKWLCAAFGGTGIPDGVTATLARFDAATGTVSQVQTLETNGTLQFAFSSEFSLDDRVLYLCGYAGAVLRQYDLRSPIIALSGQSIPTGNAGANALQMGPDGRIYVSFNVAPELHVIEHPEKLGPACGFTENAVALAGKNAMLGFPNFLSHFFQPSLQFEGPDTICQKESSVLNILSTVCGATYQWRLSPDLGQIFPLSDSTAQFVSNGTAGLTTLQLIRATPCGQDTAWMNLFVKNCEFCPPLSIDAGKDTVLCSGQAVQLQATPGFNSYHWTPAGSLSDPNIANPVANPGVPTTYSVTGTAPGNEMILNGDFSQGNFGFSTGYIFSGAAVGHFWVTDNVVVINPAWKIPNDHSPSTDGLMLVVDGDVTGATPSFWEQDVAMPSNLDFTLQFWVAMAYHLSAPTIRVEINGQVAGVFTPLDGFPSVGVWQPYSLQWNSGPTGVLHIVLRDMNPEYIGNDFAVDDISIRGLCSYSDSIRITPLSIQPPVLNLGPDITLCTAAVKKLDAGPGFLSYHWQDGSSNQSYTAFGPGKYWVTVKDSCLGVQSDTILILAAPAPTLDAGEERVICLGDSTQLDYTASATMNSFHWWPEIDLSCNTCSRPWASPTQTTVYHLVGATAAGCTALDSVRVRVLAPASDSLSVSACGSYTYGGTLYTASGVFLDTLPNLAGCDSIFRLTLNIYPSVSKSQSLQICQGSSVQVGASVYSSSGVYIDTLTTAGGCDSILTTTLQVATTLSTSQQAVLCQGESFQAGGHTYSSSGIYVDTLQGFGGCDSIVTSQVTVLPVWEVPQTAQICEKDTFWVGVHAYTSGGMYTDSLQTLAGCDSIVSTHLTVWPLQTMMQSRSICQGDTVFVGAHAYTQAGSFVDSLQTMHGCDSIVTTHLMVWPIKTTQQSPGICQGDTVFVGAHAYTQAGSFTDSLQTMHGCDSIVTTHLSVWPVKTVQQTQSFCQGDTLFVGAHTYTNSGNYRDTLQTAQGCDSIVISAVQVGQPSAYQLQLSICAGDSLQLGGKWYKQSGIFRDTLMNAAGCDSLLRLELQVLAQIEKSQALELCAGAQVQVGGHVYTDSGTFRDTLQAGGGCDSIVNTSLTVHPRYSLEQTRVICQGESIQVGPHTYAIGGEYLDSLQTEAGCDSILHTLLTVLDTNSYQQEIVWCPGDIITVGNTQYTAPGMYTAILEGANGCDSTVYTYLIPGGEGYCDSIRCNLFIPNAFSPDREGANQYFSALPGAARVLEMRIYDRWGELLYQGAGSDAHWDGRFRGRAMQPGVYVYVIQGVCTDGKAFRKVGDVTLLR